MVICSPVLWILVIFSSPPCRWQGITTAFPSRDRRHKPQQDQDALLCAQWHLQEVEAAPPPFSLNTQYQVADYRVGVGLSPILDLDASGCLRTYGKLVHISNTAQVGST